MNKKSIFTVLASAFLGVSAFAQMPIIQTNYTADPAPLVHDGKIFLYTSHDEDDAQGYGFKMLNWLLYTTEDMVNWEDHGVVASLEDFTWRQRDNGAWAQQVFERNGKFYMYCPLHGNGIGVLVSDSPYGPFKDPLGKPLVWQKEHWDDIDPTILLDDDGQAYMYWGNPNVYYVKLNEDMISTDGPIVKLERKPDHYQEGPWTYKRNGHYYMAFASTCCPEGIGYAMSDSPTGPWITRGYIMCPTYKTRGNHPGIVDYKGHSYCFGQNYDILRLTTEDHHERRSVSVIEMFYNEDGTIVESPYFKDTEPIVPLEFFNPFKKVKAVTMAWGFGLKTDRRADGEMYLTKVDDGDTMKLRAVDFGKGAKSFEACVAAVKPGSTIEVHLDSAEGKLVGTLEVPVTGGMDSYRSATCKIKGAKGVHDLVFVFKGEGESLLNWDYWTFTE